MARKIEWEIRREGGYGTQGVVTAPTRSAALAIAEAEYRKMTAYEDELVGKIMEDGGVYERSPIPDYTAHKIHA